MELGAHGVVVVARHGAQQGAVLPVPYPDGLVVAGADDPGELVVEEDGADIVEMAVQSEEATAGLVRPDLDLVVVTARDEKGLSPRQQAASPKLGALLGRLYPSPVSCGNRRRGRGHRALRSDQSGCPCGNPRAGWWRSGGRRGSMVWGQRLASRSRSRSETMWRVGGGGGGADRLGWKAMPFARDDLDSNCSGSLVSMMRELRRIVESRPSSGGQAEQMDLTRRSDVMWKRPTTDLCEHARGRRGLHLG